MDELRPGRDGEVTPARHARRHRAVPGGRGHPGQGRRALHHEELLLLTRTDPALLGYDHAEPEEEKEMFTLQRKLLLTFLATR